MDSDPSGWLTDGSQRALYERLVGYLSCPDDLVDGPLADLAACNYFAGRVLADVYGVGDFARHGGGWLTANEIADYVDRPVSSWSRLGAASDQRVLGEAMRAARDGYSVIAVKRGQPGHVALVLPGALRESGNWGLQVPNSASFAYASPDRAYVFCRRSYAFASPAGVLLYWRERP